MEFTGWAIMGGAPGILRAGGVILWGGLGSSGEIMRRVGKGGSVGRSRLIGCRMGSMGVRGDRWKGGSGQGRQEERRVGAGVRERGLADVVVGRAAVAMGGW